MSFCLPVDMCRVLDMCIAWMDMLPSMMGVRGQIQAASLNSVQQKGSWAENIYVTVLNNFRISFVLLRRAVNYFLQTAWTQQTSIIIVLFFSRCTGSKIKKGTQKKNWAISLRSLNEKNVTFCLKRLQKYIFHFCFICTSCQHIFRMVLSKNGENKR